MSKLIWIAISAVGAVAWGMLALHRGETISAAWLVLAAVGTYMVGYRVYSPFLATKVFGLDNRRATPAERLDNGRDFIPTSRWVLFGHHFAAIAGAGPLVGPVLAAQFGYLPGVLWIVFGVVLGGAVQDFIILFGSMRRDGKSLGQMAKEEIGPLPGLVAMVAILAIMIILLAVLALVIVNALKDSPWGVFTLLCTIPIAILMGFWMKVWRPGHTLEATLDRDRAAAARAGGRTLGGRVGDPGPAVHATAGTTIAWSIIVYGFAASVLPVWMLLLPRDYLSTFMKIGTIVLLALGILLVLPPIRMPALTQFIDGTGPVFAGKIFPFCFITIACGAISGFHALVSSRHHAQDDPPGAGRAGHRLRRHAHGIVRRRHGARGRHRARSRHLLRHQRAARRAGRHRRDRGRSDSRLGIHRHARGDHRPRRVGRRDTRCWAAPAAPPRSRSAWPRSSAACWARA